MQKADNGMTRRGFVAGVVGSTLAVTLGARWAEAAPARARIVRVESPRVWKGDSRVPDVVADMVNQGLLSYTGQSRPADAWGQFFKPGQRVGLKMNLLGRPLVITSHAVTNAVAAGVLLAGVKPDDLIVWDRKAEHFGTNTYQPGRGPHGEHIVTGGQYSTTMAETSGGPVPLDLIPLEQTDLTVNLPVIKDHGGSGFTGALKNIAFGCYRNHRQAHSGNCEPFITEACSHFFATRKMPLIVLDATEGCFDGGPSPGNPDVLWRENAIYVGTDPVAMDAVCRDVLMAKRRAAGLHDKTPQSRHIENAAARGLGIADLSRIDVVTVKV
jgi:uncharacterized protein (DUF362 family)